MRTQLFKRRPYNNDKPIDKARVSMRQNDELCLLFPYDFPAEIKKLLLFKEEPNVLYLGIPKPNDTNVYAVRKQTRTGAGGHTYHFILIPKHTLTLNNYPYPRGVVECPEFTKIKKGDYKNDYKVILPPGWTFGGGVKIKALFGTGVG